jgi:L-ascorbate metabolism protein UlaG (beta-lactamase superfamily)
MSPREAAYAAKLLRPKVIVPMHFGTFPVLTGKPADLAARVKDLGIEVAELKPGVTIS